MPKLFARLSKSPESFEFSTFRASSRTNSERPPDRERRRDGRSGSSRVADISLSFLQLVAARSSNRRPEGSPPTMARTPRRQQRGFRHLRSTHALAVVCEKIVNGKRSIWHTRDQYGRVATVASIRWLDQALLRGQGVGVERLNGSRSVTSASNARCGNSLSTRTRYA